MNLCMKIKQKVENDTEKNIFNFSKYVLSDAEKQHFSKYLNFCFAPKQLNYADYLIQLEFFFTEMSVIQRFLSNENLDFVSTKTKKTALSSFRQCYNNPQQNLLKEELAALTI